MVCNVTVNGDDYMTHVVMSTTGLRGISTSTGLLMSLSLTALILMVI